MTTIEVQTLLTSLASLGAAIAAGVAPASAATLALSAILREVPHMFAAAAILLSDGKPTAEQLATAHSEAVALGDPASIPPAIS